MSSDLFSLFDEKLHQDASLAATSPQDLDSLSEIKTEQEFLIKKASAFQQTEFKVDYSDYSNFVFFNSAEDYFNISGERMLNEYPYDGSKEAIQNFFDDSDGFQKYLITEWPKNTGHLRLVQASGTYVEISDIGKEDNVTKSSLLSPGTSSLTIEAWYRPASSSLATSNSAQFIFQKAATNGDSYSLYLSGSNVYFRIVSGSTVNEISADTNGSGDRFVAAVLDRDLFSGSMTIYTGSRTSYPVPVSSASISFYGMLDLGSSSFYIGSGTLQSKTSAAFTGSIGEIRVWKKARQISEISSSFNVRAYAQNNLIGLWTFAETGSITDSRKTLVYDRSGHKLDGTIRNHYSTVRASGALVISSPEPVLEIDEPNVWSLIRQKQLSGSIFDKNNGQIITKLFPESFFVQETNDGTFFFKNFLLVVARMFDMIKLSIKQYSKIFTINYTDFNQAPDIFLADVAKFYGWDFVGNFISADAMEYFVGRGVLGGLDGNFDLDQKLYEIKNELWRRCLNNLMYIYKTKGTRESIRALLHSYGVNDNLFKIKEFALDSKTTLETKRIFSQKSVYTAVLGSGSLTGSIYKSSAAPASYLSGTDHTVELRINFPLTSSADIPATVKSGTLWTYSGGTPVYYSLVYDKDTFSSRTGSLYLTSSVGLISKLTGVGIFDGEWHNLSVRFSYISGTSDITVISLKNDEITNTFVSSSAAINVRNLLTSSLLSKIIVGSPKIDFGTSNDTWRFAQYKAQEFKVWNRRLTDDELVDHAMNFQSYGLSNPFNIANSLKEHWRLDGDQIAPAVATNADQVYILNISNPQVVSYVTGTNFAPSIKPFKRDLFSYNFIVPVDMNWTDDKIRIIDGTTQKKDDVTIDSHLVSLELNMVDALNEDISQMMTSMEKLSSIIGSGASKYQESYNGLAALRETYFKRLQGRLNFRVFSDMLEFFDRSFLQMIRKLVPARATFLGDEFVVESHMLERPKVQYNRFLKQENIEFIGVIKMTGDEGLRFSSNKDDVSLQQKPIEDATSTSGISLHTLYTTIPSSVKG